MHKLCYNFHTNCHHFGMKTYLLQLIVLSSFKILVNIWWKSHLWQVLRVYKHVNSYTVSNTHLPWDLETPVLSWGAGYLYHTFILTLERKSFFSQSLLEWSRPLQTMAFGRSFISLGKIVNVLNSFHINKIGIIQASQSYWESEIIFHISD